MRDRLRAGAAVYNAGHRHAAHDLWEERWLSLRDAVAASGADPPATVAQASPADDLPVPSPAADERLLHGLIQFTAAAHHHEEGSHDGAVGLAESALTYLKPLPADYRGCALEPVRAWLGAVDDAEPPAPPFRHEGAVVELGDLAFEPAALAAPVVAEAVGLDPDPVAAGVEYAREAVERDEASGYVALVVDFVAGEERAVAHQRLRQHVERERRRDRDVDGLF